MAKIIVTRAKEWNNRLRGINIYVDGNKIGSVANGEVKTFEIPDGMHKIRAKIDWCGSRELVFMASGEEKKYFHLSGFKYGNIIMPIALSLVILNVVLRRFFHFDFALWFVIPFFLILLYYLTIGRNDYLRLKETDSW